MVASSTLALLTRPPSVISNLPSPVRSRGGQRRNHSPHDHRRPIWESKSGGASCGVPQLSESLESRAMLTALSDASLLVAERELVFRDLDVGGAAVLELAEEQRLRERLFDRLIDQPRHRTGADLDVVALL